MNPTQLNEAAETCDEDEATHVVCRDTWWMLTPPQVRALAEFVQMPPWTFTESMNSRDVVCFYCGSHKPRHHLDCAHALLLAEFGVQTVTDLTPRAN